MTAGDRDDRRRSRSGTDAQRRGGWARPSSRWPQELGRRAGIAVENARVHAERSHIATTLQRSLLPPRLPVVPG